MKQRSRLVQRGRSARSHPRTINLPVARASTVAFESLADMREVQSRFDAGEPVPTYGMVNMPIRVAFEELMVELEGGHRAATFPTGLAAAAAAIMACVKSGDHPRRTDSVYQPVRRLCLRVMAACGPATRFYGPGIGGCVRPP